jgi:hypothetical protein
MSPEELKNRSLRVQLEEGKTQPLSEVDLIELDIYRQQTI